MKFFSLMIIRHIKLQNAFQLDPSRVQEIECLTNTKLLIEPDCIQIIGESKNGRYARLLIQHSILLSYLNDDLEPVREQPILSTTSNWRQLAIEIIKRTICAFNTTVILISNHWALELSVYFRTIYVDIVQMHGILRLDI